MSETRCPQCDASNPGTCPHCHGSYDSDDGFQQSECPHCKGSGKCQACRGEGYITGNS